MKKSLMLSFAVLVCASVAMAQTYVTGSTGITGIDKLGAHNNGGRGCVGCHTPHSGARGNGGTLTGASQISNGKWTSQTNISTSGSNGTPEIVGNSALWGQDIGPVLSLTITQGDSSQYTTTLNNALSSNPSLLSGVVFCLSCHDGNVAKGAMMTNQSFEQAAGLLPSTYGSQPIPTLLGNDGGGTGNYQNDHPVGPSASIGALGTGLSKYLQLNSTNSAVVLNTTQPDANYTTFQANYGLPLISGHGGFAVDSGATSVGNAYVVCTTCHTPHTMSVYSSASTTNKIGGMTSGNFPTYFFINAPYNPGANTANGTKASSATQFCRQCHFSGAGGANESVGIYNISTAF